MCFCLHGRSAHPQVSPLQALSGCRKWLPQVTFRKTVCCRGHRGQGPCQHEPRCWWERWLTGSGARACQREPRCWWEVTGSGARAWWQEAEHPSRRRAAWMRAVSLVTTPWGLGAPHGCWDTPLLCHCTDELLSPTVRTSRSPRKSGSLSPSSTSGMRWLGLTLRWARSLPQASPSEGCRETGFRASHTGRQLCLGVLSKGASLEEQVDTVQGFCSPLT